MDTLASDVSKVRKSPHRFLESTLNVKMTPAVLQTCVDQCATHITQIGTTVCPITSIWSVYSGTSSLPKQLTSSIVQTHHNSRCVCFSTITSAVEITIILNPYGIFCLIQLSGFLLLYESFQVLSDSLRQQHYHNHLFVHVCMTCTNSFDKPLFQGISIVYLETSAFA